MLTPIYPPAAPLPRIPAEAAAELLEMIVDLNQAAAAHPDYPADTTASVSVESPDAYAIQSARTTP